MEAKPILVLIVFLFLTILFAGGLIGDTDLTPDTPPEVRDSGRFGVVGGVQSGNCDRSYSVRRGDTLSLIARRCGLTLEALLLANPAIQNRHLIHPGQVIHIPGGSPQPAPNPTITPTATPFPTGLQPGAEVDASLRGFPADTEILYGMAREGQDPANWEPGRTDGNGAFQKKIRIPAEAKPGEKWQVVFVTTTGSQQTARSGAFTVEDR